MNGVNPVLITVGLFTSPSSDPKLLASRGCGVEGSETPGVSRLKIRMQLALGIGKYAGRESENAALPQVI